MARTRTARRNLSRTLLGGVAGIAMIFAAAPAFAQSGPAVADQSRETVVVVGRTIEETLPQELEKYGSQLEVLTSEEIRNAGYVDASGALQMAVPGVFIASRGGPFSYLDVSLQGSRTQDMLFLVDGVRVNNRLYPGTITDTLPAAMVERIEVLKGGQSLFYGTNAAAGVINVVTRGYTDEFDGLVSVGGDTNNSYSVDGYVRGKFGPGNYVLYASQDKSDGYEMFTNIQPSSTNRERSYNVRTIGGKYRIAFTDRLSLDARYQHNDADLEYLRYNRSAYGANRRDEEIASLGLDWKATDDLQFLVKGYWHDWDTRYIDILNSVATPHTQTVSSDNLYWGYEDKGVNALVKYAPQGPFEYLAGYDYQQYSAFDEVWRVEQTEEEVQAVFAQIRSTDDLIENASFAAGLRYNDTGGATSTTWNASARYDFTPNIYLQGNIGTSFLLPNAEQLFLLEEGEYLGNPDVAPEESENLNAGVGGQFGADNAFGWSATYFLRNIDNLIDGASFADAGIDATQPFRGITPANLANYAGAYYNVDGEVQVRGFELAGVAAFGEGFSVSGAYTYSESENDGTPGQIIRIPKDYFKAEARYDAPSSRWGVGANLLHVGEQMSQNLPTLGGPLNYGDYTVVDISAHVFIDADLNHKVAVRLENAFDEDYATRVAAGVSETGAGPLLIANRGVPQTFRIRYTYAF